MEIFKDIEGFEAYQISSKGIVKRKAYKRWIEINGSYAHFKERIIKPSPDKDGYFKVGLSQNRKTRGAFIHRLIAIAFIPNPENKPQVNHIDGNKQNNSISNLEWVTSSEQRIHAYETGLQRADGENNGRSKLTQKEISEIRILYKVGKTHQEIADRYGMSRAHITGIINFVYWKSTYDIDLIYKFE